MNLFEVLLMEAVKVGLELAINCSDGQFRLQLGLPLAPVGSLVLYSNGSTLEEASQHMLALLVRRVKDERWAT